MARQEVKPEEKVVLQPSTMGDMPVVRQNTLPQSVTEQLANEAKAAAMLERPVGGAISLRGGQISWQGTPVAGNRLRCVILDGIFENRWYDKPFNPEQPANPACFAMAREEDDLAPHEDAENKQGGPEGKCEGCAKNAWGSDPRGGRGKACSQVRRLVLIPATALESDESTLDAETAIMKLPVTSTRYWAGYITQLAGIDGRPVWSVISEIYTEPHPKHQFHVYFNKVGFVPNERIESLRQKIKASENLLLAPYAKSQQSAPTPTAPASKKY
jgi:hypothetical protein